MAVMMILQAYSAYWATGQDQTIYHPAETTWRYAKNLSDNVFLEMSNRDNTHFHYRIASILAKTTDIDIASISSYRPIAADTSYVDKMGAKLFGSSWTETDVSLLDTSETPAPSAAPQGAPSASQTRSVNPQE